MSEAKNLRPRAGESEELRELRAEIGRLTMHLQWHGPLMTEVILGLAPPGTEARPRRLLDLGCGNGEFARRWLARAPADRAVCLNVLDSHLDLARQRLAPFGERASFILDAVEAIDRRSDLSGFDVVVASSLLHFIDDADLDRVALAVRRMLVPGGMFVATQVIAYPPAFRAAYDRGRAEHYQAAQPTGELKQRVDALRERRQALVAAGGISGQDFRNVIHTIERLSGSFASAGFAHIDVPWRLYDFAMVCGIV
jgi:SAM-dependent methyltransferase